MKKTIRKRIKEWLFKLFKNDIIRATGEFLPDKHFIIKQKTLEPITITAYTDISAYDYEIFESDPQIVSKEAIHRLKRELVDSIEEFIEIRSEPLYNNRKEQRYYAKLLLVKPVE